MQRLIALIRNGHAAFGGDFSVEAGPDSELQLRWQHGEHGATLRIDFTNSDHALTCSGEGGRTERFAFS